MTKGIEDMKRWAVVGVASLSSLLAGSAWAVTAEIRETPWGKPVIHIQGVIEEGDFEKIKAVATTVVSSGNEAQFSLNSAGGNFIEALKIGEFIKEMNARTNLFGTNSRDANAELTQCYSACFVLFVSGSIRDYTMNNTIWDATGNVEQKIEPILGLHRPYYDEQSFSALSPSQAREEYDLIERLTRQYFRTVSVPQEIVDEMFRVSSQEIRLIPPDEFQTRIGYQQPYYEEWIITRCGTLSSEEVGDLAKVNAENILSGRRDSVPQGLSPGYVEYLGSKYNQIQECRGSTIYEYQKELLGL